MANEEIIMETDAIALEDIDENKESPNNTNATY